MAGIVTPGHAIVRAAALAMAMAVPLLALRAPPRPIVPARAIPLAIAPVAAEPPRRALFAAADAPADLVEPARDAPPQLIGIAGRLPLDAVALLRLADGSTRTLRPGEQAGGWRLEAIAADRVRLRRGPREQVQVLPAAS